MPRILLTTLNAKYIHLNLAIRILYDLNKDAADLHFQEFTIKNAPEEIAKECHNYDVICFSTYIWNISQTLAAAKAIKQIHSHTKILLGGPEVSYEWEEVIADEAIDFIIVGEGEIPFAQFVRDFPNVENVPNLIYKYNEGIMYNKQNVQFDVQELAGRNPYQYDDPKELAHKVCYIETSRGCPYKCEFCLASLDNKMRYLPIDTIKDNLKYLMDNAKVIKFLDRTFNIKKDFTIDLFDFILQHYHPRNVFQFEITADIVHSAIIDFIKEKVPKGLFRFEIGIQTVNKESNLAVSRKQNFEKTSSIIKQLDDKIEMHLDLIVGLPLEYWDDVKYSFEETFKLYPPELQLGFLKFLKGTPVKEKHEQHDYVFDAAPPYQIISSKYLSKEELHKIELVENALEIYWNKKRAIFSLRYITEKYSIFDAFLGIGTFFEERHLFHKHTIRQVYQVLYEYCSLRYNDPILMDLLTLDYYLFHKIKPGDIFKKEFDKKTSIGILEDNNLDYHNFRFAVIPIHYDMRKYLDENVFILKEDIAFIQFDGRSKAKIINQDLAENISV